MKLVYAVVFVLALLAPRTAGAHGERTAYVHVVVGADEATLTIDDASLEVRTEAGCTIEPRRAALVKLRCGRDGVAGATLTIGGLGHGTDIAIVRVSDARDTSTSGSTTVLSPAAPRLTIPGRERERAVLGRYAKLGFEHVVTGVDHLLLLVALFWSIGPAGPRRTALLALAGTTTIFTIAHCLSLASVALGLVHVPTALAEVLIALSLVLVAVDRKPRPELTFAFGLVHGLGFAGGLAEVGLPRLSTALALVAFNVGVEIAQLAVVGGCFLLTALALRRPRGGIELAATLSSYVVGIAGVRLLLVRAVDLLR